MRLPKRGSLDATLANGESLSLWYDPLIRLWTLQLLDRAGDQIGPGYGGACEYHARRDEAHAEFVELAERRGGVLSLEKGR